MRYFAAIWNGPFHIGKLSQPVSIGDVLLKVLETLWRFFVAITGLALVLSATLFAWLKIIEPTLFPPAKTRITARAVYDDGTKFIVTNIPPPVSGRVTPPVPKPFRCNTDYPIKVTFSNSGGKSISDISFSLKAYLPNYSKNYLIDADFMDFNGIVKPGFEWSTCYKAKIDSDIDRSALQFEAEIWRANYR